MLIDLSVCSELANCKAAPSSVQKELDILNEFVIQDEDHRFAISQARKSAKYA